MRRYDVADRAIRSFDDELEARFRDLSLLPFDEANLLAKVREAYSDILSLALMTFAAIASSHSKAYGMAYASRFASEPSKVLKYSFSSELERIGDRLYEALVATEGSNDELDAAEAKTAWLVGEFGVEIDDQSYVDAKSAEGAERFVWRTADDERVCGRCSPLDGKVFAKDEIPVKPHPNCRCWVEAL